MTEHTVPASVSWVVCVTGMLSRSQSDEMNMLNIRAAHQPEAARALMDESV